MRVERNQGRFRTSRLSVLCHQFGQASQMLSDCLIRCCLQIQIKSCLDSQVRPICFTDLITIKLSSQVIHEVWSRGVVKLLRWQHHQFVSLGSIRLSRGNGSGVNHRIERNITPGESFIRMLMRRVAVRSLNQTAEKGRFGERKVAQIFIEENARRLLETVNRSIPAVTKVDAVAVEREDLLFTQSPLQRDGH